MGVTFTLANTGRYYSWRSVRTHVPPLAVAEVCVSQVISPAAYMPASTRTKLGKHPRDTEETNGDYVGAVHNNNTRGPPKRVKKRMDVNGVLEAAGSTSSRARHKSATKTRVGIDDKSEAAGRGAEKLAAPYVHEVYHQFLPGPSVQKELMGTTAQGQLPWVEGSEEELTLHYEISVVQQRPEDISARDGERRDGGFRISTRLSQRHRDLLLATSDDWERGAVDVLKCRFCPGAAFGNWEDFKRHCDLSEAHPLKLVFCKHCGDFFARTDSLKRHRTSRPPECLSVTPTEAEAKRRETNKIYEAFKKKLEECLKDDEVIETPFAQIIKQMFPNSSKRGSRQQSRLKAPRAES